MIEAKSNRAWREECERLTADNAQLQKDYTRIKESAALWHDRYKTKCQEYMGRQAILGAEIVALEAERAEEGRLHGLDMALVMRLTAERDALKMQLVVAEGASTSLDIFNDQLIAERDALRADAERLEYLCGDWVSETAAKRNRLLSRMSTMSVGAVRAQIDADLAAIAGEKT